jgi:FkbM family methyltransferase
MKSGLTRLWNPFLHFYGHVLPYHRGKGRILAYLTQLMNLRVNGTQVVKRRGLKWKLGLDWDIDRCIYFLGIWEAWETKVIEAGLKPGSVFFDIGANIGYFSLIAGKEVGCTGEVHAFEPSPEEFVRLTNNVQLNGFDMVRLNHFALSDRPGKVFITQTRGAGSTRITENLSESGEEREIDAVPLDAYVEDVKLTRLDLIKVDIEGAEYKFLLGARNTIERFRPIIMIELNPAALSHFDTSADQISSILQYHGYVSYIARPNCLKRQTRLPTPSEYVNAIALPAECWASSNTINYKTFAKWAANR